MMVRLTGLDNTPVYIRASKIIAISCEPDEETYVVYKGNNSYTVQESPDEVYARIMALETPMKKKAKAIEI